MSNSKPPQKRTQRPAGTPESREKQLSAAAYDLAEKQLRDGTASAAVIVHFLKLSSTREALERDKLAKETILMTAKVDSISKDREIEELTTNAMEAMKSYRKTE